MDSITNTSHYYLSYYEKVTLTCTTCDQKIEAKCNTDVQDVKFCPFCGDTAIEVSFEEEVDQICIY